MSTHHKVCDAWPVRYRPTVYGYLRSITASPLYVSRLPNYTARWQRQVCVSCRCQTSGRHANWAAVNCATKTTISIRFLTCWPYRYLQFCRPIVCRLVSCRQNNRDSLRVVDILETAHWVRIEPRPLNHESDVSAMQFLFCAWVLLTTPKYAQQ